MLQRLTFRRLEFARSVQNSQTKSNYNEDDAKNAFQLQYILGQTVNCSLSIT